MPRRTCDEDMKKDILYIFTIVILLICLTCSIRICSSNSHLYNNNLIALNDSLHEYRAKNNQLVNKTLAFEANIKDLKLLNEDLYDEIKNLKAKNITSATHFTGTIINELHDTTWIVVPDTTQMTQTHFDFSNQYRLLSGNIDVNRDKINMKIERDQVNFDYTLALDEKNNIYITSSNPYVKFNEITGFTLPKQKTKRWALGPSVNYGYDPVNNKPSFSIGCSLTYGLIRF